MKTALRLLPPLLGVAVLAALVARLGAGDVVSALAGLDAAVLAAALAIGVVSTLASALRWWVVARAAGVALNPRRAVSDYYRAQLGNAVLPAGVLGDVHRAVEHGRSAGDVGGGVRAVVLERVAGLVVLVLVAGAVLVAQPGLVPVVVEAVTGQASPPAGLAAVVLTVLVVAVGVPVVLFRRRLAPIGRTLRALAGLRVWPAVVVLSLVSIAGYLATFVLAARAAGVTAPVAVLLPALVLALLVMAVPLNVGGFGPREAVASALFGVLGLGAAAGFATAVVYGVLSFVAVLPGLVTIVSRLPAWAIGLRVGPATFALPAGRVTAGRA